MKNDFNRRGKIEKSRNIFSPSETLQFNTRTHFLSHMQCHFSLEIEIMAHLVGENDKNKLKKWMKLKLKMIMRKC